MDEESKWAIGSKEVQNQNGPRVKMGQGLKWAKSQNGPRVKMATERVKLTLNSKKETNGRVKMDHESR